MRSSVTPSSLTRVGAGAIVAIICATTAYLIVVYASLPDLLPVHFKPSGVPDGWQYKTPARVLMPAIVQLTLATTFGAVAALLLSRGGTAPTTDAPDVRAASAAAEGVTLISLIWVVFQAYSAVALVWMWQSERAGLGLGYTVMQGVCLVVTGWVAVRAHIRLGRPEPRPYVAEHWRLGQLYKNADDPALFVPTRDGRRWTLNFGRPLAAALLGLVLLGGILAPTIILALALR